MRGILFQDGVSIFRVSTKFYPEELIVEVFGEGERFGDYFIFKKKMPEVLVLENFNKMIELMVDE